MGRFDLGFDYRNFHFIGIGGISMSALAQALFEDGCMVSGSDQSESETLAKLRALGMSVFAHHDGANIPNNCQVVVYNAAVAQDNPEIVEARGRGLKLLDRAGLLGLLMRGYEHAICVAGTHGKTTTTSMLAEIFMNAGCDPTVMNGGFLTSMGGSMRIGADNKYFIVESCEYHNSFLKFDPYVGIILNLELDHKDFFKDERELRASFRAFAEMIPSAGLLVLNRDIPDKHEIIEGLKCQVLEFGREPLGFELLVPGEHNVENARAAVAVARHFGLCEDAIKEALQNFTGANRRFQKIGFCQGAEIVDDYAHHPTEVAATLTAARELEPSRLWVVFQPHTPGRTAEFLQQFAESLTLADKIIVTDIYRPAGRREEEAKVHARDLTALIEQNCTYIADFDKVTAYLKANLQKGDMAITMGAGDVYKIANMLCP